jgi:hypothetical protein
MQSTGDQCTADPTLARSPSTQVLKEAEAEDDPMVATVTKPGTSGARSRREAMFAQGKLARKDDKPEAKAEGKPTEAIQESPAKTAAFDLTLTPEADLLADSKSEWRALI